MSFASPVDNAGTTTKRLRRLWLLDSENGEHWKNWKRKSFAASAAIVRVTMSATGTQTDDETHVEANRHRRASLLV